MNHTNSDWKFPLWSHANDLQKYETCRQQSKCYLLAPPPRPPTIPELFLSMTCQSASSSSTSSPSLSNLRSKTDTSAVTVLSILLGLIIAFTSACLILILLGVKFQFHQKWRSRRRQRADLSSANSSIRETNNSDVAFIKTTTSTTNGNTGSNSSPSADGCTSFSSVAPISYDCLTPLTNTTLAPNSYPSLRLTNPSNSIFHLPESHLHETSTNVYEEIRPSLDRHQCRCCCSCSTANHYTPQQYASTLRQLTPHYYTCEPAPSISSTSTTLICQSCLLETLHRKQQASSTIDCACRHFFMPIK